MSFKKLNNLVGWGVFLIATIVYFLTMEPTVSWWDCGEYISTAYKLQVGHPPGAPLFQLIGRFFTLFAFGDVTKVAMMINIMSCLCSSFTILFLYWTISMLAQKIWMKEGEESPRNSQWAVIAAAAVGALAFTFTDSFWFNAVEGEVYAMSSLLTAITFWAILKWEQSADEPNHYRWIIFIAYIIGLSIGVHLLNLLVIPAIVYVVYFKKYDFTWKGFILVGFIAVAITGFVYVILIPSIVSLAGELEIFFVNDIGLPFNFGTIIYFMLIIALIVWGLWFTTKKNKPIWNTIVLSFMFILIGYSSFFMLVIRANANTPINENEPKDAISMLSYLKREQYGSWPILYGPYYSSKIYENDAFIKNYYPQYYKEKSIKLLNICEKPLQLPMYCGYEDKGPVYKKDYKKKEYVEVDRSRDYVYDDNVQTIFPRMWSNREAKHIRGYERYVETSKMNRVSQKVCLGIDRDGKLITYKFHNAFVPTFGQNLRFFLDYQCNWMYWRYFMWNFVGRQNDTEGQGEIDNGNWISGIGFIDNARLGDQSNLPRTMQSPAKTKYYFLPLILGLIGLFYQLKKDAKSCWVNFLLFFMTGLAIVIYLNQTPEQPRERDYSYAGSFYAFAIWIGFGVLGILDGLMKIVKNKKVALAVTAAACMCVPVLMAAQGWEGHDRSGKTSALDWGKNYLTQLPPNAVIFTRGDNDTFPLWYVQEVEGYRTDVRVCNYMLASASWYVNQMGRKVYKSERLPLTLTPEMYDDDKLTGYIRIVEEEQYKGVYTELKDVINDFKERKLNYFPARKVKITVDKEKALANGIVPERMKNSIVDEIAWTIKNDALYKNDLMLLDFLATSDWERAVYFTGLSDILKVLGINDYLYLEGLTYRFIPVKALKNGSDIPNVNIDDSYDLLVNKARWGNLNKSDVTIDPESARDIPTVKTMYVVLAQALVGAKRYDEAINVMDKCLEFFPDEKVPFREWDEIFVELYYTAGDLKKANDLFDKIETNAKDEQRYYKSLEPEFQAYYKEKLDR